MDKKEKWNRKHTDKQSNADLLKPNERLRKLIRGGEGGPAIDLACGLGANSFLMAEKEYQVTAVDFSEVAINFVKEEGKRRGYDVNALTADLKDFSLLSQSLQTYDLVIMTYYLDRSLFPVIERLVKPGGCFFMETFFKTENGSQISEKYTLTSNELLTRFKNWRILYFEECEQQGIQTMYCQRI